MLKIFLLTKNESFFIEDWIKYHGYNFGMSNIHILDGSDDTSIFNIYNRFIPLGLNVHYSSAGLNDLCEELNNLMHKHKGDNNLLIKLDTDEFLTYTEPFNLIAHSFLVRFLRKGALTSRKKTWVFRKILSEKVMDIKHAQKSLCINHLKDHLKTLPITGQRYKASLTTWSLPTQEAMPSPCRDLTRFTAIQYTHMKSFFHSSNFVSVDLGCHKGVTTQNLGVIDTGMTIVHYHSTSVEDSVRRAEQVLISHGYFDAIDDLQTKKEKLIQLRASGQIASFHKIDLYLNYIDSLESGVQIQPSVLNMYHPHFRPTRAQREIRIIRDTLEYIDTSGKFATPFESL